MQGEAMTTQAARRTPFHLLVTLSNHGPSSGGVFLDDGVAVTMGEEGGNWSLVKFSADLTNEGVRISSSVMNAQFAMSQKWIIDRVTIFGLTSAVRGCIVQNGSTARKAGGFKLKTNFDEKGRFIVTELAGLDLLIGKEFELKLWRSKVTSSNV